MADLREALEKALENLPTMAYSNGYRVQALPKVQLLEILAAHKPPERLELCYPCFVGRCVVFGIEHCDGCACPHTPNVLDAEGEDDL